MEIQPHVRGEAIGVAPEQRRRTAGGQIPVHGAESRDIAALQIGIAPTQGRTLAIQVFRLDPPLFRCDPGLIAGRLRVGLHLRLLRARLNVALPRLRQGRKRRKPAHRQGKGSRTHVRNLPCPRGATHQAP